MKINQFSKKLAPTAFGALLLAGASWVAPTASADDNPTIYSLMPNTALSGVVDPNMPDRKAIPKAWPKTPANAKNIRVGWSEITLGNPWFVELAKAGKRTAAKDGFTIDMQVADGDLQRQCSQIDTFVTQKMDVIVVDPTDTLGVGKCINRAVDAGIPVVTLGTVPTSDARVLTTITPNPYANGFGAGEYVAQSAGKDKPIVAAMIIGVVGNSTSESRLDGMVGGIVYGRMQELGLPTTKDAAMLRGFKLFEQAKTNGHFDDPELKFKVLAMGEGKWTEAGGLGVAEDIISAHGGQLNYILADNDFMGLGALKALRNVGKQGDITIATPADGDRAAIEQIKKGNLLTTGTYGGQQTGDSTIAFLNDIFHKGLDASDLPMGSYFPADTITKANADSFIDPDPANKFYKYTVSPVLSIPQIKAELAKK